MKNKTYHTKLTLDQSKRLNMAVEGSVEAPPLLASLKHFKPSQDKQEQEQTISARPTPRRQGRYMPLTSSRPLVMTAHPTPCRQSHSSTPVIPSRVILLLVR
ncbi:hypothetical protein O3P69_003620 [Scylla paramamosain]|uniref:Uncharacterized protein n=1 Tax=Scylla paramamosain TaxID=85552 RepID=A0AAW0UJ78_SCYPA